MRVRLKRYLKYELELLLQVWTLLMMNNKNESLTDSITSW
jgi:hypothetical protein